MKGVSNGLFLSCSFPMVIICINKLAHQCLGIFGAIIVASMGSEWPHAWSSGPGSSPGQGYWTGLGWALITGALNHKSYMMLAHYPSESYLILLIHNAFHLHGLYVIYSGAPAEHHNYRERNHKYAWLGNHGTLSSGMDHGRVRPTTTTSHNMVAIQLIPVMQSWITALVINKQQFLHSDWLRACQLIPNQCKK